MKPKERLPTHPGEVLREDFLIPMGLTQRQLAEAIGVFDNKISGIISGKIGITPSMAWKLARALGTSPEVWTGLQSQYDLARTEGDAAGIKRLVRKAG